jgi:hypothetical protein
MSEHIPYRGRTLESRVKARLRMSSEMGTFLLIDRFSHCHTEATTPHTEDKQKFRIGTRVSVIVKSNAKSRK